MDNFWTGFDKQAGLAQSVGRGLGNLVGRMHGSPATTATQAAKVVGNKAEKAFVGAGGVSNIVRTPMERGVDAVRGFTQDATRKVTNVAGAAKDKVVNVLQAPGRAIQEGKAEFQKTLAGHKDAIKAKEIAARSAAHEPRRQQLAQMRAQLAGARAGGMGETQAARMVGATSNRGRSVSAEGASKVLAKNPLPELPPKIVQTQSAGPTMAPAAMQLPHQRAAVMSVPSNRIQSAAAVPTPEPESFIQRWKRPALYGAGAVALTGGTAAALHGRKGE